MRRKINTADVPKIRNKTSVINWLKNNEPIESIFSKRQIINFLSDSKKMGKNKILNRKTKLSMHYLKKNEDDKNTFSEKAKKKYYVVIIRNKT